MARETLAKFCIFKQFRSGIDTRCRWRPTLVTKLLPHSANWNGCLQSHVLSSSFGEIFCHTLWQYGTERFQGFSPLWIRRCVLSLLFLIKFWPHSVHPQGLYSLSGKMSYRKISWSLEAARFGFKLFQSFWNSAGTSAAACQISERYDHCSIQSRGFETSRDLAVRRLTARWIEAQGFSPVWIRGDCYGWPLWMRRCATRFFSREKLSAQTVHWYGFTSVWIWTCLLRWSFVMNALPHIEQRNGLAPLCMRKCTSRVVFWEKLLPQTVHSNGFSPVWIRKCLLRSLLEVKSCPHTPQLNGFWPMCTRVCSSRDFSWEKLLPQTVHSKGFTPVWIRRWVLRLLLVLKLLPHISHLNGFAPLCTRRCTSSVPFREKLLSQSEHV